MNFRLYPFLLSLLLLPVSAQADTYVLKNGRKIEARLISETETHYLLEVQLAATIKEEQKIDKNDVQRIIKPEKGLSEFEALKDLVPAPDGLKVAEYKQRIERLNAFLEQFPSSSKVRIIIDIRNELRDEMRLVEDGSVKIAGVLYPASEIRENAYELDAKVEAAKIKELVAAGLYLQALRAYKDFSDSYQYTSVNQEMIPLMLQVMRNHVAQAEEMRATYDQRVLEREKGFESMKLSDQHASRRAIEEQDEFLRKRYQTEVATQVGWVTTHPFCKQSLDYTVQFYRTESRRIEMLQSRVEGDAGELYRELYRLQQQGVDERLLRDKYREAQRLKIPKSYLEKLSRAREDSQ